MPTCPGWNVSQLAAPCRRRSALGARDRRDPGRRSRRAMWRCGICPVSPTRIRPSLAAVTRRGRRGPGRPPCGGGTGCADVVSGRRRRLGVLRPPIRLRDRDAPRRRRAGAGRRVHARTRRCGRRHRRVDGIRFSAFSFRGSPVDARAAGAGPHDRPARHRHGRTLAARPDRRRHRVAARRRARRPPRSGRRSPICC